MSAKESRPGAGAANKQVDETTPSVTGWSDAARVLDGFTPEQREFITFVASNERSWFVERTAGVGGIPPESPYEVGSPCDRAWRDGWIHRAVISAIRADELAASDLATIPRPTHEQMVARRIAEMERRAAERHARNGTRDWSGLDNQPKVRAA